MCAEQKNFECFVDHNSHRVLYWPCFKFLMHSTAQNNSIIQYKARHYSLVCSGFISLGSAVMCCHRKDIEPADDNDIADIGKHGALCDDHLSGQLVQSGYKTNECPLL